MSNKKIDVESLYVRQTELYNLISDTYAYMDLKQPSFERYVKATKSNFDRTIRYKKDWIGAQFTKAAQSGDFRKVIIGGAIYGAALLAVTGYEFIGDQIDYKKAESRLLPYYQELASKQGILQKELIMTLQEKEKSIDLLKTDAEKYKQKLQELEEKQMLLTDLLTRFTNLSEAITK